MSNDEQQDNTQNGSVMDTIGETMEGVGASMDVLYASLEKVMQQNQEITQTMSVVMEQIYRANLKITSTLKPAGNDMIDMSLIINNQTEFPIVSMTGLIKFETNEVEIIYEQQDNNLFEASSCNLAPQTQNAQLIHFKLLQPMHCNGEMIISFPHPMTGKLIEIKRTFALYILDQLDKKIIDKSNLNKLEKMFYPVQFIREIMEIHPIKGMDIGMCIELSSTNCKVVCEIIKFSEDHKMVQVEFSGDSMELVSKLISELNKLSQV